MLRRLGPTHLLMGRAKASGCCCLVGDDLGHRAMVGEYPWLARRHVSGRGGLLDHAPCAMSGETDDGPSRSRPGLLGIYFYDPNGIRLEFACQPEDGEAPAVIPFITQTKAEGRAELETLPDVMPEWIER